MNWEKDLHPEWQGWMVFVGDDSYGPRYYGCSDEKKESFKKLLEDELRADFPFFQWHSRQRQSTGVFE